MTINAKYLRVAGRRHHQEPAPSTPTFTYGLAGSAIMLALAILVLLVMSSCGNSGATITIKELKFEPDTVTIKVGQSVTWKNEDRRSHHIMSGAPPVMTDEFVSPVLEKGDSWSFTFEKPGEYPFHDMKVPGLLGRVIVEE